MNLFIMTLLKTSLLIITILIMTILTIPYTGEVTYNSFYLQNTLLITVNKNIKFCFY
jgi:hypothetical protein